MTVVLSSSSGMHFLFIVKQKKNVDTFEGVIASLLADGHRVTLAVQQRDPERDQRLGEQFGSDRFVLATCPDGRGDAWRSAAPLVRSARDWAQYYQEPYRHATKLHQRAADRLLKELGADVTSGQPLPMGPTASARLRAAFERIEEAVPSDPLHEEFFRRHAPDVVLVTPGLHFGSGQADFIKSARALGLPVWMLLFSWDNLSTKGALHVRPDLMFVWNERQRHEAEALHGYPADRVIAVGAPRFDEFFSLRSAVRREDFFAPLGLDPARPALLYVCSSKFIAARELGFIRSWLGALRQSDGPLRDCSVIVRPHPDVTLVADGPEPTAVTWPAMPRVTGWIQRPFGDPAAIVLRTTYRTQEAFFECLHHAHAVIGLNTSAELEAGIAGRPVFTVLASEDAADGQAHTLHFSYLLREQGGFVSYAPDMAAHVEQLSSSLSTPPDTASIRACILAFLRPHGDAPVAPRLARELAAAAGRATSGDRVHDVRPGTPAPAPSSEAADGVAGTGVPPGTLRLGNEAGLVVHATPEAERRRHRDSYPVESATAEWMARHVQPGDVFYDIGAGIGAYTILGAARRGAMVVAIEPGFAAFKALCDNIRLNGCHGNVVPLPVALGERAGLLELHYTHAPGDERHTLLAREWRPRRESSDDRYTQPVCAEPLEDLVTRNRLPRPNVVRLATRRGAAAVLSGAGEMFASPDLRAVLISVADDAQGEALLPRLAAFGFAGGRIETPGGRVLLALERVSAAKARPPLVRLRRAYQRVRRLW